MLREASDLAVGDTVNCYVRLVEKSSGRLTVSRERVDTGSLRKERVAARLRKQIKRGTLAPGKQRVATVINYVGDFLQVDAGGILADIDAPDEEDFSEGDRIMVRIESVDERRRATRAWRGVSRRRGQVSAVTARGVPTAVGDRAASRTAARDTARGLPPAPLRMCWGAPRCRMALLTMAACSSPGFQEVSFPSPIDLESVPDRRSLLAKPPTCMSTPSKTQSCGLGAGSTPWAANLDGTARSRAAPTRGAHRGARPVANPDHGEKGKSSARWDAGATSASGTSAVVSGLHFPLRGS